MNLLSLFEHVEDAVTFETGKIIFDEESPGDVMYVILDGEVDIFASGQHIETLGKGDILGEMALIDSKPRSASALARSDCRLAPVDEERFLYMVQETPFFSLHVMRILADRLRRINVRI